MASSVPTLKLASLSPRAGVGVSHPTDLEGPAASRRHCNGAHSVPCPSPSPDYPGPLQMGRPSERRSMVPALLPLDKQGSSSRIRPRVPGRQDLGCLLKERNAPPRMSHMGTLTT